MVGSKVGQMTLVVEIITVGMTFETRSPKVLDQCLHRAVGHFVPVGGCGIRSQDKRGGYQPKHVFFHKRWINRILFYKLRAQGGLSVADGCRCLTKELDMIAC